MNKEELKRTVSSNELTYLEKSITIVDEFAAGNISADEAYEIAKMAGIARFDLEFIYDIAYPERETPLVKLIRITENPNSTYFQKCEAIADVLAYGGVSDNDAVKIAKELRVDYDDVINMLMIKYKESIDSADKNSEDEIIENSQSQNKKEPTQSNSSSNQEQNQDEKNSSKSSEDKEEKSILDELYSLVKKEGEEIAKDIKDKIISEEDGKIKFDFGSFFKKDSDKKG